MSARTKEEVFASALRACQLAAANAVACNPLDSVIVEFSGRVALTSSSEAEETWGADHHRDREDRRETDVLTFWSFSRRPQPADEVAEHLASSWSPPLS